MKRILVISDEHGDISKTEKILSENYFDLKIHLGDTLVDHEWVKKNFDYYLVGNNDLKRDKDFIGSWSVVIKFEGINIYAEHGTGTMFSDFDSSPLLQACYGADIYLFGHTHIKHYSEEDGKIFLNPGSVGAPRDDDFGSYSIIEVENSTIKNVTTHRIK